MSAPTAALIASPPVYERDGWCFEALPQPLWGSERIDELARERKLCHVPDMFCGDAALRISHRESGTLLELTAKDALRCCSWKPQPPVPLQPPHLDGTESGGPLLGAVLCQFADHWKPNSANPDVKELEVTSDWTCSTPYWGTLQPVAKGRGEPTEEELPMELLRQRDEILWYQEVLFWEDELGDNGLCRLILRVRVMPTFWFALLVCELRVDNVLIREVATRFFCKFGSDHILREWTWREASYEALRSRGINVADSPQISSTSIGTTLLGAGDVRRQLRHRLCLRDTPAGESQADQPQGST